MEFLEFDILLKISDIVSLHVPLTESTHHLIDAYALQQMKPTAYLINTARGAVVDESALVEALQTQQIAGAALDVFEAEPLITPALLKLPNVLVVPHIGTQTVEARIAMGVQAAENLKAFFEGKIPPNKVL